jgi:hypothetical protein
MAPAAGRLIPVADEDAHLGLIRRLMVLTRSHRSRDGEVSKDRFVLGCPGTGLAVVRSEVVANPKHRRCESANPGRPPQAESGSAR